MVLQDRIAYFSFSKRDDEESTPEDLSPWEIVPAGQDFNAMYNVGPELSVQDKRRAREILDWLMNNEEFQLYVEPVDYYSYRQYLSLIAYPICLQTVYERLEGNFYRSKQVIVNRIIRYLRVYLTYYMYL